MIGEILDAKYRIDKQLGAGGMGNVYLATHLGTTRIVAVKVIAPKWAAEPQFLARFQREAQACGRLRHPNIVNITDFGIANTARGDQPYLVMEFLDGQTLSDFQRANPGMPLPLVADLLDQIGLALAEAHRYGIIHRDLKPDNIWLESNGRGGYTVKVLDFGVAKVSLLGDWGPGVNKAPDPNVPRTAVPRPTMAGDELETVAIDMALEAGASNFRARAEEIETVAIAPPPSSVSSRSFDSGAGAETMPGSLLGTPAYMSPEQALGKEIDYRSDIYSLAVVAYSLVCGQLPFTGKSNELAEYHQSGYPTPPASIHRIPRDVSDAILAGLARDPADRPASAIGFTRRFHNAVDAEFLSLRRSKAFLLQHLAAYALLLLPIYTTILSITGLLVSFSRKLLPMAGRRIVLVPLAAAALFIFSDNLLRAAAALMAMDEQVRVRRFLSFRVFWKLLRMMPVLAMTQAQVGVFLRARLGYRRLPVAGHLRGRKAIGKGRRSAVARSHDRLAVRRTRPRDSSFCPGGIRHCRRGQVSRFPLAKWIGSSRRMWSSRRPGSPCLRSLRAAPLFLYDRTAANERVRCCS